MNVSRRYLVFVALPTAIWVNMVNMYLPTYTEIRSGNSWHVVSRSTIELRCVIKLNVKFTKIIQIIRITVWIIG